MCPYLKVMIEFVLIAQLHLSDGRFGPSMNIDYFSKEYMCIDRARNAEDIVEMIKQEWYAYMDEEASHGHPVPPIDKIAMYCKPLEESGGQEL